MLFLIRLKGVYDKLGIHRTSKSSFGLNLQQQSTPLLSASPPETRKLHFPVSCRNIFLLGLKLRVSDSLTSWRIKDGFHVQNEVLFMTWRRHSHVTGCQTQPP